MDNYQLFEITVFRIIRQIIEAFPDDSTINLETILTEAECPEDHKRKRIACNTFDWLRRYDYVIQKSGEIGMVKYMVMPSEKLLAIMGKIPPALEGRKQTLREFFAENAKAGIGVSIQSAVQALIQMGGNLIL